jgi:hypothetical protein
MRYHELTEAAIPVISPQAAYDAGMFGPVYHGTRGDLAQIIATGFDVSKAMPLGIDHWSRPFGSANGYSLEPYGYTGIAPPVHHLGFGVYMTTSKSIAKQFAGGTLKGMRAFYLATKRMTEINFGAPRTMMGWWREHGYDMTPEATQKRDLRAWTAATLKLTVNLQREFDAVWYKGKSMYRLLDGDQVCIYNPDVIRVIDPKLAGGLEIGAKVRHTQVISEDLTSDQFFVDDLRSDDFGGAGRLASDGWRGIFRHDSVERAAQRSVGRYPMHFIPPPKITGIITRTQGNGMYSVKWAKGGEMYNYRTEELQPA